MSDIRYLLKNGDPTSSGGHLITTRSNFIHCGAPIGVEGDIATCPACNSSGPVFNNCNPHWDIHGKQVLVNGALVYCKCPKHPFVMNTQYDSAVEVQRTETKANKMESHFLTNANHLSGTPTKHDEKILFIDRTTGQPLVDFPYRIIGQDRILAEGHTAADGSTIRVSTDGALELYIEHTVGEGDGWE